VERKFKVTETRERKDMCQAHGFLTDAVRDAAQRSVLCWLATVAPQGQPNVSPKEVWAISDAQHVVVANIASPITARNIASQPKVCLSFVDVFVQKGYKLQGIARELLPDAPDFAQWAAPLLAMVEDRFVIRSVLVIKVQSVQPIVAPSYWMYPHEASEAKQIAAAMQTYAVRSAV
jgi:predicted pyridoxine 5'-phosphate oxidase superfamily flavin-nucleotide-binding protein